MLKIKYLDPLTLKQIETQLLKKGIGIVNETLTPQEMLDKFEFQLTVKQRLILSELIMKSKGN